MLSSEQAFPFVVVYCNILGPLHKFFKVTFKRQLNDDPACGLWVKCFILALVRNDCGFWFASSNDA